MLRIKGKKGFTLVELLIAIGLLSLFAITIGVSLNRTFKKQKEQDYNNFIKKVVSASNLYVSNEGTIINKLSSNKGYLNITINDLIKKGLLSENTINPKTNDKINKNDNVKISYDSNGTIKVEYPSEKVLEDYLQALDIYVDFASIKKDYCYQGLDTANLVYVTSSGDFVKGYLKKNENIFCDGEDKIDPNKLGTYRLVYSYTLKDGTFKRATRQVIVSDNYSPTCIQIDTPKSWINTKRTINVKCSDIGTGCLPLKTPFELENYADNYKYMVKDKAGNTGYCYLSVYSDTQKPECSSNGGSTTWINTKRDITLKCHDSLSGCSEFNEKNVSYVDTNVTSFTVKDKAGNENTCQINVYSDTQKPECSYSGGNTSWTNKKVTITQKCTDQEGLSGCLIPSEDKTYSNTEYAIFTVKDRAGNTSNTCKAPIYSDITAPTCTNQNQNTKWTNKKVTINTYCEDNLSGCIEPHKSSTFENIATKDIEVKDKAGNTGVCKANIYSDTTPPTANLSTNYTASTDKITMKGTGKDTLSGIVAYQFSTNSNLTASSSGWTTISSTTNEINITKSINIKGTYTYYFYTKDAAGNIKRSNPVTFTIKDGKYYCWYIVKNGTTFKTSTKDSGSAGYLWCRTGPGLTYENNKTYITQKQTIKSANFYSETKDSDRTYGWYKVTFERYETNKGLENKTCYAAGYWIVKEESDCGSYKTSTNNIMPNA